MNQQNKTSGKTVRETSEPFVPSAAGEKDGRIDRIVNESRRLGDDVVEWINLRMRLIQLDFQEKIDEELDHIFSGVMVMVMFGIAIVMGSIGVALMLGRYLGDILFGFGILAAFYAIIGFIVLRSRPKMSAGFRAARRREHAPSKPPAAKLEAKTGE